MNIIKESGITNIYNKNCNNILIINPPQINEIDFDINVARTKSYPCHPPYGAGVLCRVLEKNGYITEILDLNYEILSKVQYNDFDYGIWKSKLKSKLIDFNPDMIGISCMFSISHNSMKAVSNFIKEYKKDLPIIVGGVHPSMTVKALLEDCASIDFVGMYESEDSFIDLLEFINGRKEEKELTQIATMFNGNYSIIHERSQPSTKTINVSPQYHNLPIENYNSFGKIGAYHWLLPENTKISTILSNRGCRGHCTFCSVRTFNGKGIRQRNIENVVDEMEHLLVNRGVKHFMWLDDDLLYNKKRAISLFEAIVKRNLGISWDATNGVLAYSIDDELMNAAYESGCIGITIGIESGNPKILKSIRKPGTVEIFRRAGEVLKKFPGIFTKGFLMTGFPNETIGQTWDTINLARDMSLDWYPLQILSPLPSTEIIKKIKESNLEKFGETKYFVGSTGRQKLREKAEKLKAKSFINPLLKDKNYIPTKEEIEDIWFMMDYYVNYKRILAETDLLKLEMKRKMLINICDSKTNENPEGNLFLGIIEQKLGNEQAAEKRFGFTRTYLKESAFWKTRFRELDLEDQNIW